MKKILLAGGAGYIGTELCKRLLKLDYKVTVIDDLWFGNHLDPKIELIKSPAAYVAGFLLFDERIIESAIIA